MKTGRLIDFHLGSWWWWWKWVGEGEQAESGRKNRIQYQRLLDFRHGICRHGDFIVFSLKRVQNTVSIGDVFQMAIRHEALQGINISSFGIVIVLGTNRPAIIYRERFVFVAMSIVENWYAEYTNRNRFSLAHTHASSRQGNHDKSFRCHQIKNVGLLFRFYRLLLLLPLPLRLPRLALPIVVYIIVQICFHSFSYLDLYLKLV